MLHSGQLSTKPRAGADGRRPAAQSPGTSFTAGGARPSAGSLRGGRGPSQPQQHPGARSIDENNEVVVFLKEIGLEQYALHFLRSGFDDLETLMAIEDTDMKELGIPAFHTMRLRRKLQDMQRQGSTGHAESDPNHPVVLFLEEAGLGQYAKTLLRNGFDDLDTLCDIEDTDMKDLGIPRGHTLKLKKRLRDLQLQQYSHDDAPYMPVTAVATHKTIQQVRTPQRRMAAQVSVPQCAMYAMPTAEMKSAVERSWDQVQSVGTYAMAEMLYRHTFDILPDAVHLFPSHVRMKYREWSADEGQDESNVYDSPALRKLFSKFINAVGCAVAGLHDNTKLVPMLTQLGRRHMNYGVHSSHFQALGKAFNATLSEILGPEFTQEVEGAWTMAYNFMSSIMMEGLRGAMHDRDSALAAGRMPPQEGEKASISGSSTRQVSDDLSNIEGGAQEADGSGFVGEGHGL